MDCFVGYDGFESFFQGFFKSYDFLVKEFMSLWSVCVGGVYEMEVRDFCVVSPEVVGFGEVIAGV